MKIIKYILVLLTLLGIGSCDSSLGYDPNVQITNLDEDSYDTPPDTNSVSTIFTTDSIKLEMREDYHKLKDELVKWTPRINAKNIKLDTSESYVKLWLDLDVESLNQDNLYKMNGLPDRVTNFNLSFSAILNNDIFTLKDSQKSSRWLETTVKQMPQNKTNQLNGSIIPSQLVVLENDKELGLIKLLISVEYDKKYHEFGLEKFFGYIWIFYK